MENMKFGKLTVKLYSGFKINNHNRKIHYYICLCECGKVTKVAKSNLISGHSKSCGCSRKENARYIYKHRMYGTKEYTAWSNMKQRCYNKMDVSYKYYGGRGITVCDEWITSFESFYSHIGKAKSAGHSVDRINNDLGYQPGNVRWATPSEQNRNRRKLNYGEEKQRV